MVRKILNWIGYIFLALFLITILYVFTARIMGKTPKIFGYGVLRVQTGSMEPHLAVGDVILIKSTDPADLNKGDVVTYNGREGEYAGKTITHQIVEEPYESNGEYHFTTQGTAPGAPVDPAITGDQIEGKVLFTIPLLGSILNFFSHWYGFVAVILLLLVAFGSELINVIMLLKRSKEDNPDENFTPVKNAALEEDFHEKRNQEADELLLDLDKGN